MRVVFIQGGLGAGGAEKNIARLARHRAESGDEVHVISMTTPVGGPYFALPDHVTIHAMQRESEPLPRLLQLRRLFFIRDCLKRIKPDLVISFLTKLNVLTLIGTLGKKWPVIVSERNNPELQRAHFAWKHLNHAFSHRASAIVMLTQRAAGRLSPRLRRRAEVIPNPCAPNPNFQFRPTMTKRVIAVGRLDHQKGFDLLIYAFRRTLASHPDATLTIFGEGVERATLEALIARLKLQGSVRLFGTTKSPGAWIELGDILVMPSRHEGFSNVLLEAMVAGIPSIAADCDFGPSEIIPDSQSGILVPTEDVGALAEAMTNLLADRELQERLSHNAVLVTGRFTEQRILAQWDQLIDRIVKA
jgi:glycosyltransferase involved in cell wall biosynthesis